MPRGAVTGAGVLSSAVTGTGSREPGSYKLSRVFADSQACSVEVLISILLLLLLGVGWERGNRVSPTQMGWGKATNAATETWKVPLSHLQQVLRIRQENLQVLGRRHLEFG